MARQDARELTFSGITQLDRRHRQLGLIPSAPVAILDFSGKARSASSADTLATCLEDFLADLNHLERLRPHTLRAYRYELAAAAADPRFQRPLPELDHKDLEAWLVRGKAATSTVGRRVATFRHLFAWAIRRGLRMQSPLVELAPLRGRRTLPRPIREQHEQRALDAAIASAPPPYRLIFTLLRERGVAVGPRMTVRSVPFLASRMRRASRPGSSVTSPQRRSSTSPARIPVS